MKIEMFCVGPVRTNCYLVYDEDSLDAFVIDPGDSAHLILDAISKQGLKLQYIILTHGHFDHVLAVPELLRETKAKLVCSRFENIKDARACGFQSFRNVCFTPLDADCVVSDGDTMTTGSMQLRFIETPGHTTGSMCILCGDTLFSGDTLFAGSCGRCDLPGGSFPQILGSLKKLHDLPGDYRVLPGHEGQTTLQSEREHNTYMREALR